jgi:hypothetical protein
VLLIAIGKGCGMGLGLKQLLVMGFCNFELRRPSDLGFPLLNTTNGVPDCENNQNMTENNQDPEWLFLAS